MEKFRGKSVCLGLDVDPNLIPPILKSGDDGKAIDKFLFEIIQSVKDVAGIVKPNLGFYLKYGSMGISCLEKLMNDTLYNSGLLSILDAKFGDVENSSKAYSSAAYQRFHADAVTINPYIGLDGLEDFIKGEKRSAFVLCKTSNKDSGEFQNRPTIVSPAEDPELFDQLMRDQGHPVIPMYLYVAYRVKYCWNEKDNCGLVVGANHLGELSDVRKTVGPEMSILSPAIGAQTDSKEQTLKNTIWAGGGKNTIINLGRSTLYSKDKDFAEGTRKSLIKNKSLVIQFQEEYHEKFAQQS